MYQKLIILILISTEFLHGTSSRIDSGTDDAPIRNKSLQQKSYDHPPKTQMMKKPHELWLPKWAKLPAFNQVITAEQRDTTHLLDSLKNLPIFSRDLHYRWKTASKRVVPYHQAVYVCNVPRLRELYVLNFNPTSESYYYPADLPELTEIYINREFALTGYAAEGSVISYQCSHKVTGSKWELKWALLRLNKLRTDFHDYATINAWSNPMEPNKLFSRLDLRVSSVFSPFAVYCFLNDKESTPNADGKRCENDKELKKCCSLHAYLYEVSKPLPKPVMTMTANTFEEGSYFKATCYSSSWYYFDTFTWVIVFANNTVIYPQSTDSGHLTKYNMAMYNITLDTKINGTFKYAVLYWDWEYFDENDDKRPIHMELTSTFEIENITADHNQMQLLCFSGLLDYDDPDMTSCGERNWCSESGPITIYNTDPTKDVLATTDNPPSTNTPRDDHNTTQTTHGVVPTSTTDRTTTVQTQTTAKPDSNLFLYIAIGVPFHIFFLIACISLMRRYSWRRSPHLKQNETVPDNAADPGAQGSVQESDGQSTTLTVPDEATLRTQGSPVDKMRTGKLLDLMQKL